MDKQIEEEVNAAIKKWRQGDCVVGELGFVYCCDHQKPITADLWMKSFKPATF